MKILVILIIFVFALSLFRMILEWSKNNNSSVESVDAVVSEKNRGNISAADTKCR